MGSDLKLKEIKIFISHPNDTEDECQIIKGIINQETANNFSRFNYKFIPICWKDTSFPGYGRPQDRINPLIQDPKCKLVIIVLWTRFGSQTGKSTSGVEEEYEMALTKSKEIMIYFSDCLINPSKVCPNQLAKVKVFKERITNERKLMYWEFDDKEKFEAEFRKHFTAWGHNFIRAEPWKEFPILTKKTAISHKISKAQIKDKLRSITKGF